MITEMIELERLVDEIVAEAEARNRRAANEMFERLVSIAAGSWKDPVAAARRTIDKVRRA